MLRFYFPASRCSSMLIFRASSSLSDDFLLIDLRWCRCPLFLCFTPSILAFSPSHDDAFSWCCYFASPSRGLIYAISLIISSYAAALLPSPRCFFERFTLFHFLLLPFFDTIFHVDYSISMIFIFLLPLLRDRFTPSDIFFLLIYFHSCFLPSSWCRHYFHMMMRLQRRSFSPYIADALLSFKMPEVFFILIFFFRADAAAFLWWWCFASLFSRFFFFHTLIIFFHSFIPLFPSSSLSIFIAFLLVDIFSGYISSRWILALFAFIPPFIWALFLILYSLLYFDTPLYAAIFSAFAV